MLAFIILARMSNKKKCSYSWHTCSDHTTKPQLEWQPHHAKCSTRGVKHNTCSICGLENVEGENEREREGERQEEAERARAKEEERIEVKW